MRSQITKPGSASRELMVPDGRLLPGLDQNRHVWIGIFPLNL
jgi:hypothetical protein